MEVSSYIFWWQRFFNKSFYISSHGSAIDFVIWTSSLFLQTFLFINSISFYFEHWICHPLANLFPSFWLFLVLFWTQWMLVDTFKAYHVSSACRMITWGTLFTKKLYSVSKFCININSNVHQYFQLLV